MATAGLSPICYNHPEKKADFKCFDCKRDSVINLCPQCNIQVHSLDVFRAHRVEHIEIKDRERRLSQDVDDIEKLIAVESDILQNVLTRLKYCEEEEKEAISHLVQLQTATKKRIAEIKECEARIEKAFGYLTKVSTLLTQCSIAVDDINVPEAFQDPCVPEATCTVPSAVTPQQPSVHSAQESVCEPENGLPTEPLKQLMKLPDEVIGKDIFPVSVVGSLARNGSFWMVKVGENELQKQWQIHTGLRTYYHMHGYGSSVDVSVGAICAILNRNNKEFCRVRVESVASSGMVKVRFLDFGFVENVQPLSLCRIPAEFLDIPFQALECCLLPDLNTQLPYEAKWCFKDLTFNKFLMAALEGQVTDSKGHTVNFVTLASCGEVPVCINTKVTQLVEEQRVASEDRPVQPKADKVENDAVVVEEINHETPSQADLTSSLSPDAGQNVDNIYETDEQLLKTDEKISVGDVEVPALSASNDVSNVSQIADDIPAGLRAEAAEFVPGLVSSENSPPSKTPFDVSLEQNVPGILRLPVMDDKIVRAKPAEDGSDTVALPQMTVPEGYVDFAMYKHILAQCSLSIIPKETLPRARFFMVRSHVKRVVESMKYGLWCSLPESGKRLNRVFNEQASKGGNPVFFLFSGVRSSNFCGMAKMESAIDPNTNCPTSIVPSLSFNKAVGCCVVKWFYAQDLFFGDVLTPECGFHKRYLINCGDGTEIPNKLGQMIVRNYESCNYFRSILKYALQSYQLYLSDKKDSVPSSVEPLMSSSQPQLCDEGLLLSQEEDWDREIEDSKAAKYSENEPLDSVRCDEELTPFAKVATALPDYFSEGHNILGTQSFNDDNGAAVSYAEDDIEGSSVKQTVVVHQESISYVSSSTEKTNSDIMEAQNSSELALSTSLDTEVEKPALEIVTGNESDWESSSPGKRCGEKAIMETTEYKYTEFDSTVTEHSNTPSDAWGTQAHEDNSQGGETWDARKTEPENIVFNSDVMPFQDLEGEHTDKQTTLEHKPGQVTSQEDLLPLNGLQNTDELAPLKDSGFPGVSNSVGVVSKVHTDSLQNALSLQLNSTNNVESLCTPANEAVVQELESECGGQHEPQASSDASDQASVPAKSDLALHESSEDLLCDYDDLPVEIGKEDYIYALESLSSNGTFWARVHKPGEDDKRFMDAMTRMGAHIEANNKPLENIFMYKHCAVRGLDNYWYRALVEETSVKGKVGVRLLDLGDYWEVDQKELRVLDDEFYVSPPAQAFECSVCYENPNNKKERNTVSRLVKRNKRLRVIVKNCSEGTVGVQILS